MSQATIPVLDFAQWMSGEQSSRVEFAKALSEAFRVYGFVAVKNSTLKTKSLDEAYGAFEKFFSADMEKKDEVHKPELFGERGYIHSETAQGQSRKDHKEHYHVGPVDDNSVTPNLWPSWMDLEGPASTLVLEMKDLAVHLQRALSLCLNNYSFEASDAFPASAKSTEPLEFLPELTKGGSSLVRALHYPFNSNPNQFWAAAHTDVNLFTILPRATEEGLEVFMPKCEEFPEGKWIPVVVPDGCVILNCGDELQSLSNGYWRSSLHRVMSKPNVERYSMVYFVHPNNESIVDPIPGAIEAASGVCKFPTGVRAIDFLMHRLMELGLAEKKWESPYAVALKKFMDGNQEGNKSSAIHPSVELTDKLWRGFQEKAAAAQQEQTA